MPANSKRLAEAVERWRTEKALTQQVIAARGGPSTTSMTKIATGEGSIQGVMLSRLDQGLGWGEGMAAQILAGGPTPWDSAPVEFSWRQVGNAELLQEVARRMAVETQTGGTSWPGIASPEDRQLPDDPWGLAAYDREP